MFNFTTQTVFNSITANKNLWVATNSKKPAIRIGNIRFDKGDIVDIQVKKPTPEFLSSVTFDMSGIIPASGEITARIALYIGLSMNSQDSFYSNALAYKGKPFYIEFGVKSTDTADAVAKKVKANADKYLLFTTQEKILDVTAVSTPAVADPATDAVGTVTFTGVNGYQQIVKAELQVYNPEAVSIDCCANIGAFETKVKGVPVTYTISGSTLTTSSNKIAEDGTTVALASDEVAIAPGIEAFGDYNWIIHNLRLPTAENTHFWAVNKEEMPIAGQTYTQFIVTQQAVRDGIAGGVVGQRATSITTHVFYVAGDYTVSATPAYVLKGALATLLGGDAATKIKTDADTKLAAPFV